jgi:uncharacterized integral membrane protein (TIGR00698 family)
VTGRLRGILACAGLGSVAFALGGWLPFLGGPVLGVVFGIAAAALLPASVRASMRPGIKFVSSTVLQVAIVLLGTTLDLGNVVRTGASSLPVMLGTLVLCLGAAAIFGPAMRIDGTLRTLIGVGTGICGVSAIAAVSPIVGATESQIAYAITTIFVYNIAALVIFPPLGHLLGLSPQAFGLWAGTAINDTSSVVAAGLAYGPLVGNAAVVVKLTRTLLIIPIVIALSFRRAAGQRIAWRSIVPPFVAAFVLAALLDTLGVIPAGAHLGLATTALYLIVVAITAIGLSTDFAALRATGPRPLLLGALLWIVVAISSLIIARFTGLS